MIIRSAHTGSTKRREIMYSVHTIITTPAAISVLVFRNQFKAKGQTTTTFSKRCLVEPLWFMFDQKQELMTLAKISSFVTKEKKKEASHFLGNCYWHLTTLNMTSKIDTQLGHIDDKFAEAKIKYSDIGDLRLCCTASNPFTCSGA